MRDPQIREGWKSLQTLKSNKEIKENVEVNETKLYQIDFDYGKLGNVRASVEEAPARANTPVKIFRESTTQENAK